MGFVALREDGGVVMWNRYPERRAGEVGTWEEEGVSRWGGDGSRFTKSDA